MVPVAVAIIIQNNSTPAELRVLLCQRKSTARYPFKWEFPGGKFEDGETAEQCLYRELLEELTITANIGPLFHREKHVYPDSGTFDVFYHLIPSFVGAIANRAFAAIEWVPMKKLPEFDILEGNREVIRKLMNSHAQSRPSEP